MASSFVSFCEETLNPVNSPDNEETNRDSVEFDDVFLIMIDYVVV